MRVEGKGVPDSLLSHQGEACGVHITKGMISVAVQDLVGLSFQVFSYEHPLQFPALRKLVQKPIGLSIALANSKAT